MTLSAVALEGPLKLMGDLLQAPLEAAGDGPHLISRSIHVQHINMQELTFIAACVVKDEKKIK